MTNILSLNKRFPYLSPVISALVLVLTLPPFNFWPIVFFALIPMYIFIFTENSFFKVFIGGILFGLIFSSYLSFLTLLSFTWIPEAHLFSSIIKALSIPIVLLMSTISAFTWIYILIIRKKTKNALERSLLFGTFALVEWVIGKILFGFNYGSLAYAAGQFELVRLAGSFGGVFLITFLVVFINASIAEILFYFMKEKNERSTYSFIPIYIVLIILVGLFFYKDISKKYSFKDTTSAISVSILQNNARKESTAFGSIENGHFRLKSLEKQLYEARKSKPDVIIYPFSPWVGVLSDTLDNSNFNKKVVAIDFKIFSEWLNKYVPQGTIFITWNTLLKDKKFWNEMDYWRGGKLIDSYRKRKLFPFFDYTPKWSKNFGLYTTPYDATAGNNTSPVYIGDIAIGNLVCSEIIGPQIIKENGVSSDIIFSVGSEAMFSNQLASEFNLLNAQFRAVESGQPVVRANKFGPSAIIDQYGNIIQKLEYNENGILSGNVIIGTPIKTVYERISEYPFIIVFILYTLYLWIRNRKLKEIKKSL